jgi:hypothetical protein
MQKLMRIQQASICDFNSNSISFIVTNIPLESDMVSVSCNIPTVCSVYIHCLLSVEWKYGEVPA